MCVDLKVEVPGHLSDKYPVLRKIGVFQRKFNDGSIVLAQGVEHPDKRRNYQEDRKHQDLFPELKFLSLRYPGPLLELTIFQICCFTSSLRSVQLAQP